jgi:hypothetical protein
MVRPASLNDLVSLVSVKPDDARLSLCDVRARMTHVAKRSVTLIRTPARNNFSQLGCLVKMVICVLELRDVSLRSAPKVHQRAPASLSLRPKLISARFALIRMRETPVMMETPVL